MHRLERWSRQRPEPVEVLAVGEVVEPVGLVELFEQVAREGGGQAFGELALGRVARQAGPAERGEEVVDVEPDRRDHPALGRALVDARQAADRHAEHRAVEQAEIAEPGRADDDPTRIVDRHADLRVGVRAGGRWRPGTEEVRGRGDVAGALEPCPLGDVVAEAVVAAREFDTALVVHVPPEFGEAGVDTGGSGHEAERVLGGVTPPAGDGVRRRVGMEAVRRHRRQQFEVVERITEPESSGARLVRCGPQQSPAEGGIEPIEAIDVVGRGGVRPVELGERCDDLGGGVDHPAVHQRPFASARQERANDHPAIGQRRELDRVADRVGVDLLATQQRIGHRPVQVDAAGAWGSRVERRGVVREPGDGHDLFVATGGHDVGLHVDRHQQPLAARQRPVPGPGHGEVDARSVQQLEAGVANGLGHQFEVGQAPVGHGVTSWNAVVTSSW